MTKMKEEEINNLSKEKKKKNLHHNREQNAFSNIEKKEDKKKEKKHNVKYYKVNKEVTINMEYSCNDTNRNKNEISKKTIVIKCDEKEKCSREKQMKKTDTEGNNSNLVRYVFEQIPIVGVERKTNKIEEEEKEIQKKEQKKEQKKKKEVKHANEHRVRKDQFTISENINSFQPSGASEGTDVVTKHDSRNNVIDKKERNADHINTTNVEKEATPQISKNSKETTDITNFIQTGNNSEIQNINNSNLQNERINNTNEFFRKTSVEMSDVIGNRNEVETNTAENELVNLEYMNNHVSSIHFIQEENMPRSSNREHSNLNFFQGGHMDEEMSMYMKPCFLSKFFRFKIGIDYEEYSNKLCRVIFFIVLMFSLFLIDSFLLYKSSTLLKSNNKLVLIENKFNNVFMVNLLYITPKQFLQQHRVTVDTLQDNMVNNNYALHNQMCTNLQKFSIPCDTWIELYVKNGNNVSAFMESAKNKLKQLEEKNIYMYRIKEKEFMPCNNISRKHLASEEEHMFLFLENTKYVELTTTYVIFTLLFVFIRGVFILSRIVYEILILLYYKEHKLTLKSKKRFLLKYLWFICTISIIEIMLGEECLIWWLNGITPTFLYYFQYAIWAISLVCSLTYCLYVVCKKKKTNSSFRDGNSERNRRTNSVERRNTFLYIFTNVLNYFYHILFYFNIFVSFMYMMLCIHKTIIFIMGLTILVLLIDVVTDSYLKQMQILRVGTMRIFEPERKKFYIIELKKKDADFLELEKINEHSYQRMPVIEINMVPDIKNEKAASVKQENNGTVGTDHISGSNELNNCDTGRKKKNKTNNLLTNLFNKRYFNKKSGAKSLKKIDNKLVDNTYNATLEFCEICDEHYSNTILYPCMHGGFCEACVRSLLSNNIETKNMLPQCPLCRENIHHVYKILNINEDENQQKIKAYQLLTIKSL